MLYVLCYKDKPTETMPAPVWQWETIDDTHADAAPLLADFIADQDTPCEARIVGVEPYTNEAAWIAADRVVDALRAADATH